MKEIKPLVTGKNECYYREKSFLTALFGIFTLQDSISKIKLMDILIECSDKSVNFSFERSFIEIISVVMENHEFKDKDKTLLVAAFGIFGLL